MLGQSFVKTMIALEMCYSAWWVFHHQNDTEGRGIEGGRGDAGDIERGRPTSHSSLVLLESHSAYLQQSLVSIYYYLVSSVERRYDFYHDAGVETDFVKNISIPSLGKDPKTRKKTPLYLYNLTKNVTFFSFNQNIYSRMDKYKSPFLSVYVYIQWFWGSLQYWQTWYCNIYIFFPSLLSKLVVCLEPCTKNSQTSLLFPFALGTHTQIRHLLKWRSRDSVKPFGHKVVPGAWSEYRSNSWIICWRFNVNLAACQIERNSCECAEVKVRVDCVKVKVHVCS